MKILAISAILLLTACNSGGRSTPPPPPPPPPVVLTLEEQVAARCGRGLPPARYEACVQIWTERLSNPPYRN